VHLERAKLQNADAPQTPPLCSKSGFEIPALHGYWRDSLALPMIASSILKLARLRMVPS
jgi:hypothetical protein